MMCAHLPRALLRIRSHAARHTDQCIRLEGSLPPRSAWCQKDGQASRSAAQESGESVVESEAGSDDEEELDSDEEEGLDWDELEARAARRVPAPGLTLLVTCALEHGVKLLGLLCITWS